VGKLSTAPWAQTAAYTGNAWDNIWKSTARAVENDHMIGVDKAVSKR
jgi:hypothetical protein